MSYARFNKNSDVYIYGADKGIVCCGCSLIPVNKDELYYDRFIEDWVPDGSYYTTDKYSEMIEHVKQHIDKGDKIPEDTIPHLLRDKEKDGGSDTVVPFKKEE